MTQQAEVAQVYFEDINVDDDVPSLVKGPMSPAHLMRWSSAMENWHRIHYDELFAKNHDRLPERLVNGSWKQHVLVQMMKDWIGLGGWVWKIGFQFRGMDIVGDTITAWGKVIDKRQVGDYGIVECEIGLANQRGENGTPGTATAVFPLRGRGPIPYPFVPPEE